MLTISFNLSTSKRRKVLIEELQQSVASLNQENKDLRGLNDGLRYELQAVMLENRHLRMFAGQTYPHESPGPGGPHYPPPPGAGRGAPWMPGVPGQSPMPMGMGGRPPMGAQQPVMGGPSPMMSGTSPPRPNGEGGSESDTSSPPGPDSKDGPESEGEKKESGYF
jgi:hypothetical protein